MPASGLGALARVGIPLDRLLLAYATLLTVLLVVGVTTGFARGPRRLRLAQLDVERINVVEPDGTLRLVIASKARLPGVIVKGRETPHPGRTEAGMLFFNEEGTENGGLIFGGRNRNGARSSSGQLSFDAYEQDQVLSVGAEQEGARTTSALTLVDRPAYSITELLALGERTRHLPAEQRRAEFARFAASHPQAQQRLRLGRNADSSVGLTLKDPEGRDRLVIQVAADGTPVLRFLDASGAVAFQLPAERR